MDFIAANPDRFSKLFWRQYFLWSLRRHFNKGLVTGEEHIAAVKQSSASSQHPTIFACTHGSWWDAALTIELSLGQYQLEAYGMMEYKQLTKYRFFSRIGMFSVVREDSANALHALRYGSKLLMGTNHSLWMFPQGQLIHQDVDRIQCEPGIGILATYLRECRIIPVALRYELLRDQYPTCWVRFGEPMLFNGCEGVRAVTATTSDVLTMLRDTVRDDAMSENSSHYRTFFTGRRSVEKMLDALTRK